MGWQVDLFDQRVVKELDALPVDLRAKFDRVVYLIEDYGPHQVQRPHVAYLRDGLWEIRMRGRSGSARAIYVPVQRDRIVILHAFPKKTRKTPKSAVEVALARMRELNMT